MALYRLCNLCGHEVNSDLMDYVSLKSKDKEKDICNSCMNSSVRITLPNGTVVTGLGAFNDDYSTADVPVPPTYAENPATQGKPQ